MAQSSNRSGCDIFSNVRSTKSSTTPPPWFITVSQREAEGGIKCYKNRRATVEMAAPGHIPYPYIPCNWVQFTISWDTFPHLCSQTWLVPSPNCGTLTSTVALFSNLLHLCPVPVFHPHPSLFLNETVCPRPHSEFMARKPLSIEWHIIPWLAVNSLFDLLFRTNKDGIVTRTRVAMKLIGWP